MINSKASEGKKKKQRRFSRSHLSSHEKSIWGIVVLAPRGVPAMSGRIPLQRRTIEIETDKTVRLEAENTVVFLPKLGSPYPSRFLSQKTSSLAFPLFF